MTDEEEEIQRILESIPDKFDVMEEGIDIQTQKEYIELSHSFGEGELTEQETIKLGSLLCMNIPVDGKKRALSMLAHIGTVVAFRQIEQYSKSLDPELQKWAYLALRECRMFLENSLGDDNNGLIISGMGGIGERMRIYFFVLPLMERPFTSLQKDIIRDEYTILCTAYNSVIETFYYADNYVGLTLLIPFDVAIATIIDNGIKKCNELGAFVLEHYYVTNMGTPDVSEIPDIIRIVMEGEPE